MGYIKGIIPWSLGLTLLSSGGHFRWFSCMPVVGVCSHGCKQIEYVRVSLLCLLVYLFLMSPVLVCFLSLW